MSAEHATLFWHDEGWCLRDLGSTNGSWLDGARLEPGERHRVAANAELRFGGALDTLIWVLTDASPPAPRARRTDTGEVCVGQAGVLVVPDDAPVLSVFVDGHKWVAESDEQTVDVIDQDTIDADGIRWRLELPPPHHGGDVSTTLPGSGPPRTLDACELSFRVSRDEEFVELSVRYGPESFTLAPRSHHYTLLTLARQRMADGTLPEAERGWVYADELASQLRTTRPKLNLHIWRARQQLSELGIEGAGRLVQRRPTSHQLRLGLARVEVAPLE